MAGLLMLTVLAAAVGLPIAAWGDEEPDIPSGVVWKAGVDGYHTYRIPALIATKSGTLLAFCEGRKTGRGDAGDIDLLLKRSTDSGNTWGAQQIVYEEGGEAEITIGNPCPVVDRDTGTIWLALCRNNQGAFITSSKDDGLTWAEPQEISEALKAFAFQWTRLGTGPVNGIQLANGRLVLPVWLNERRGGDYRSAAIISDDHGASWKAGGVVPPTLPHCNECTVAELGDGRLYMSIRNKSDQRRRGVSWSEDGGLTWSDAVLEPQLVGPVCQAAALRARDPSTVLFSNPASTNRENLRVRISRDAAKTWSGGTLLWPGPAAYSCLIALSDGRYGCLFEAGEEMPYESIRFARFNPEQLDNQKW
jgi:sialidase-1